MLIAPKGTSQSMLKSPEGLGIWQTWIRIKFGEGMMTLPLSKDATLSKLINF